MFYPDFKLKRTPKVDDTLTQIREVLFKGGYIGRNHEDLGAAHFMSLDDALDFMTNPEQHEHAAGHSVVLLRYISQFNHLWLDQLQNHTVVNELETFPVVVWNKAALNHLRSDVLVEKLNTELSEKSFKLPYISCTDKLDVRQVLMGKKHPTATGDITLYRTEDDVNIYFHVKSCDIHTPHVTFTYVNRPFSDMYVGAAPYGAETLTNFKLFGFETDV